jgi:peptide/nickel transport system substrate-binding protein
MSGSDVQSVDPAIDHEFLGGNTMLATCLKLVNYPDRPAPAGLRLVPEAAAAMPMISADGRTYTFTIRPGLRFNTGEEVTAAHFAHAFKRVLGPTMSSPGASFALDIVGAEAVLGGRARSVAGISVRGSILRIRLVRPAADFLNRVALNFFCAVPLDYPIDPKLQTAPAAAGPYFIARRVPNRSLVLERNPYYRGRRPHHLDAIVFSANTDVNASYLQVRRGEADYDLGLLPPQAHHALAREFGVNRSRYFVHATNEVDYVALNSRPGRIFSDRDLRRAANYAVDRPALVRQRGFLYGEPTDQILPPTCAGFMTPTSSRSDGPISPRPGNSPLGKAAPRSSTRTPAIPPPTRRSKFCEPIWPGSGSGSTSASSRSASS